MDQYQKFVTKKAECKRNFMGKMFFPRKAILLFDLSETRHPAQYKDLLTGLNNIGLATFVMTSDKNDKMPQGENLHYISPQEKDDAYGAADFVLIFDNSKIAQVLKKGCVPISQLNGDSTINYNPLQERGNGFYFKNPTKWELFAAVVRALEAYQFPYDWENLICSILKSQNRIP